MNAYAVVMKNGRHELAQGLLTAQLAEAEWFGAGGEQRWQEQIAQLKAAIAALSQPYTLHTLCKTPECAVESISPFEGAEVLGMATIAVESEPVSGLRYRVDYGRREAASPQVSDEVLSLLRDMRAQLPPGSQDPITFMRKDNPLAARADRVIAELTQPVVMRNYGNSEAEFIADGERLDCPACGGSGHKADAPTLREAAAAGITDHQRRMRGTNPGSNE